VGLDKKLPEISIRSEELDKCVNCGMCQAVCPTYLVKRNEGLSARGKIMLLKGVLDGTVRPSASLAEIFDDCLTCYACQTACPAGVKTERLWTPARQDLAAYSKTSLIKRLGLNWTIGRPRLFEREVRLAGELIGFEPGRRDKARLRRRSFPIFRGAPYLRQLHEEYPPFGKEIGSVGLLLGCSVNLSTPWVADAVISLLNAAGWRVIIPRDQVCCGAPAINNSCWDIARRLARQSMLVFSSICVDRVTSVDSTCAGTFAHDYLELFRNDSEMLKAARRLAEITEDIGDLLAEALDESRISFIPHEAIVTLHDSCHTTHVGGGSRWRDLLSAIDGLEVRELKDSDHCCGFGGSYAFFHNETSSKIGERKVESVLETGADQLLVGSPGCLLQIQSVMRRKTDKEIRVRHVAELLAEVIREE